MSFKSLIAWFLVIALVSTAVAGPVELFDEDNEVLPQLSSTSTSKTSTSTEPSSSHSSEPTSTSASATSSSTTLTPSTSVAPLKSMDKVSSVREDVSTSTATPQTLKPPVLTRVGVPGIVAMNLLRSNLTDGGKKTNMDLGILGGFITVHLDRRTDPVTGRRTGPISVSILGQKIYGNRKRRSVFGRRQQQLSL